MNINFADGDLTQIEKQEIEKLLLRQDKNIKDDLEQMWHLIDLVWDDYKCNNRYLDWEKIDKFYSHPVWLLNGFFIEQHDVSMGHRHAISDWIVKHGFKNIVDFGGGFGTLARLIAQKDKDISVDIYEPHPSIFGLKRINEFQNIHIVDKLKTNYDCLISTDVLEHVPDPLNEFANMIKSVKRGGYLVIANNFTPVVKCHLPQNFYFRYSFNHFAKMMGLEVLGLLEGSHATIFKKTEERKINWKRIRFYERLSKIAFPIIEFLKPVLRPIKHALTK